MPSWLMEIIGEFWGVLSEMAPYLLFGFFVAGLLSVLISPKLIERHLGGRGLWPVIKAAAFGVPLPLCSCGVIPVAASLRRHGAGRGPTIAFLISTPQTGVDSILVTFSLLGWAFAIFRALAALVSGVIGGALVSATERHDDKGDSAGNEHNDEPCQDTCCVSKRGKLRRILAYGFGTLPRDIGRALLVGLILAAMISTMVRNNIFSVSDLVEPGLLQIVILMAVGIPIYVCATASIPLAYALILAGVSPGAVFAFLMTGPATNAATIATIWKIMGKRATGIYLAVMVVAAVAGGLLLDQFLTGQQVLGSKLPGWMLPPAVKHASAVALLGVLLVAIIRPFGHKLVKAGERPEVNVELKITGMTCSHCVAAVRRALLSCHGVAEAEVDLDAGRASIVGESADPDQLCQAVSDLGYNAELSPVDEQARSD